MTKRFTQKAVHTATYAILLALVLPLPGCEAWNAWLDFLKWKTPGNGETNAPLVAMPQPAAPVGPAALIPRVTLYRLTLPVGAFSTNEKIWSQLNEDAIDSKTSVLMAQNGLRAATGSLVRWPIIAKLLDAPGATTDQTVCQTDGRSSINVVTRPNVTDQIVISVDRDLQQQGRSFDLCDNGFLLTMRGVRNKPELMVQLEPIVTLGKVAVIRSGTQMGVTGSSFTSEETFSDLTMSAPLTADQFLVVSAVDPNTSPFSVGTLWLSDKDHAPATETVLIFVPVTGSPAKKK